MKAGDKLRVMRSGNISQTYVPWGSTCEYVATFDAYVCVSYKGQEYLINKNLLVELNDESR